MEGVGRASFPEEAVKGGDDPLTRLSDICFFLYFSIKQVQKSPKKVTWNARSPKVCEDAVWLFRVKGNAEDLLGCGQICEAFHSWKRISDRMMYQPLLQPTLQDRKCKPVTWHLFQCSPLWSGSDSPVQTWWIYPEMNVTYHSACRSLPLVRMIPSLWSMRFISIIPIFIVYLKGG